MVKPMPKRTRQDPDNSVPVRVEVVLRRGLSRPEAARYVRISTSTFNKLVQEGMMPQPFRIDPRTIWDLRKLDAASDLLSGPEQEADSFANWS
jgi:predicted DNA-binding transcriptional regulator AlpA